MLRENKYTFPLLLVCATVGISSLLAEHIYFGRREDKLEARAGTNFVGREISERVLAQNNFNEFSYTSEKQEDAYLNSWIDVGKKIGLYGTVVFGVVFEVRPQEAFCSATS